MDSSGAHPQINLLIMKMTPIRKTTFRCAAAFFIGGIVLTALCFFLEKDFMFYPLAMGASVASILMLLGVMWKGI